MFELMARVILSKRTDWGRVVFERIVDCMTEPNLGRILSIFLREAVLEILNLKLGARIHHMRRMDIRMLDRWDRVLQPRGPEAVERKEKKIVATEPNSSSNSSEDKEPHDPDLSSYAEVSRRDMNI
ncbi:hypothetical protein KSP39_PZI015839 [Platanthera zijinensis]|uniref:Uncharacterized protein n=1 Tax=Platanthera zijinensis TaxID=2320716 RepID=A0AAP0B849_9ASPA